MKKLLLVSLLGLVSFCLSYGQSKVTLTPTSLYNGKLEILLPDSFQLMATESLTQINPEEGWPNLVYMNKSRSISIELMYPNQPMSQEMIPVFKDILKGAYEQKYPSAVWKSEGVEVVNGKNVGFFEFVSKSKDGEDIYDLEILTEVDGKIFTCSILFPVAFFENWVSVGKEIMRSIQTK
jgi:hypothetical protein